MLNFVVIGNTLPSWHTRHSVMLNQLIPPIVEPG